MQRFTVHFVLPDYSHPSGVVLAQGWSPGRLPQRMKQFCKAFPILVVRLGQRPADLIYTEIPFPSVAVPTSCHEIIRIYWITTAGDGFDVI